MRLPKLALIVLVGVALCPQHARAQSIYQRKAKATAVISGSHDLYDGTFTATGTANMCGEIPRESSMTGVATFVIEYPYDDPGNAAIQSISFGSKELVGKVTKGSIFTLNVHVRKPNGSKPFGYVLNTDPPGRKNTGTATLTRVKNAVTLNVRGVSERNETINFTITCY